MAYSFAIHNALQNQANSGNSNESGNEEHGGKDVQNEGPFGGDGAFGTWDELLDGLGTLVRGPGKLKLPSGDGTVPQGFGNIPSSVPPPPPNIRSVTYSNEEFNSGDLANLFIDLAIIAFAGFREARKDISDSKDREQQIHYDLAKLDFVFSDEIFMTRAEAAEVGMAAGFISAAIVIAGAIPPLRGLDPAGMIFPALGQAARAMGEAVKGIIDAQADWYAGQKEGYKNMLNAQLKGEEATSEFSRSIQDQMYQFFLDLLSKASELLGKVQYIQAI